MELNLFVVSILGYIYHNIKFHLINWMELALLVVSILGNIYHNHDDQVWSYWFVMELALLVVNILGNIYHNIIGYKHLG